MGLLWSISGVYQRAIIGPMKVIDLITTASLKVVAKWPVSSDLIHECPQHKIWHVIFKRLAVAFCWFTILSCFRIDKSE